MKFNKKSKGFTLIELLVVIAIIGLLATVVLVSVTNSRQKARDVRRISDLRQITLALEMYAEANNRLYPDGGDGRTANGCNDWNAAVNGLTVIQPQYISALPSDPTGTTPYAYESDGSDYVLRAQTERATEPSLAKDVDGTVLSCDCSDNNGVSPDANRYYCIKP